MDSQVAIVHMLYASVFIIILNCYITVFTILGLSGIASTILDSIHGKSWISNSTNVQIYYWIDICTI